MDLRELREREDFDQLLCTTLSSHFEQRECVPYSVTVVERPASQVWFEHRIFGVFTSSRPSRLARRFLASLYRFTNRPLRMIPQALAVTAASTALGARRLSKPALWISPALPYPEELALIPGNQRVRLMDFRTNTTRVMQKAGFELATLEREWRAREQDDGPFLPILDGDVAKGWLSEPIVDGWALARCPPWIDRSARAREALARLALWADGRSRNVNAIDHAGHLVERLAETTRQLDERFQIELGSRVLKTAETIGGCMAGVIRVGRSHGDCQPGNIIVPRDGSPPILIDLEHASERSRHYDALTFTLRSRSARGFAERAAAYLDGCLSVPGRERETHAERRLALGIFVLEDLLFFASESLTGPFHFPSAGLKMLVDELNQLALQQGSWWNGL